MLLALERSTEVQSAALVRDGAVEGEIFSGLDSRSGEWAVKVEDFLRRRGATLPAVRRILVGAGPGSFAGIRSALAFAQGAAIATGAQVLGVNSAAALARPGEKIAVAGDARRGRFWVIRFDGYRIDADFALVPREELPAAVGSDFAVRTPDGARIGAALAEIFGARYLGAAHPEAAALAAAAAANPALAAPGPLPVYLTPAVRGPEGAS